MSLPRTHSRSPIGIDYGGYAIKAVQLERARGSWRIHAALSLPLPVPNHPLDAHMVRFLRDSLHRQGFTGERVVLAAPTRQLEVDVLELPPASSGAPIHQIARMELARSAKIESDRFELGWWDLPAPARAGAASAVMAVALRHEHADAILDPFCTEGFHVVAMDTRPWAMARAASPVAAPDGITAVLDIGWSGALMVLIHGGVVVYQRTMNEIGLGILARTLRDELKLADDEAEFILRSIGAATGDKSQPTEFSQAARVTELVGRFMDGMLAEIQPAFDYAAHRYAEKPLKNLLLCGGGAGIAGVCDLLSARLSLPASVLAPAKIFSCPPELTQVCGDGAMTVALGLALHGAK
jgi:type IV pilus assembly protein PilM